MKDVRNLIMMKNKSRLLSTLKKKKLHRETLDVNNFAMISPLIWSL